MRKHARSFIAGVAILALVVVGTFFACAAKQPTTAFNPDQRQGEVRLVLLRTYKEMIFTDKQDGGASNACCVGKPVFKAAFWIEFPMEGAFNKLLIASDFLDISVGGKSLVKNAGGGGMSQDFDQILGHEELRRPDLSKDRAAFVEVRSVDGVTIPTGPTEFRVKLKWKGKDQTFLFKDVPVI